MARLMCRHRIVKKGGNKISIMVFLVLLVTTCFFARLFSVRLVFAKYYGWFFATSLKFTTL